MKGSRCASCRSDPELPAWILLREPSAGGMSRPPLVLRAPCPLPHRRGFATPRNIGRRHAWERLRWRCNESFVRLDVGPELADCPWAEVHGGAKCTDRTFARRAFAA